MSPPLQPERGWPITATGTARSSSNQVQPGGATPAPPDSPGSASLAQQGRAWPCTCGGAVRFSGAALAAYARGDGAVLVTVEQAAHNWSDRHAAWSGRIAWRHDAYERRRDLAAGGP